MERINDIFLAKSTVADKTTNQNVKKDFRNVQFSGICFNYPNEKNKALEEINLELSAGQTLGIVGVIGGGKTTLCQMLLRFYDPDSGDISISGKYRLGDIRHNYADLTKIKDVLGFSPEYDFHKGIIEFVKWVKTQDIMEDKYESSIIELKQKGLIK